MAEENTPTMIALVDDEGAEVVFEHIMTFEYKENVYIALVPQDGEGDADEEDVVFLRVEPDANGEDMYVTIEDDTELENVYLEFVQILDEDEEI